VAETHLLKSRRLFEILKDHAGVADATEALAEVANDRVASTKQRFCIAAASRTMSGSIAYGIASVS
jgi:hypothetical protein